MNIILTSLNRLNEMATLKPETFEEKIALRREESTILTRLEDAGRKVFYNRHLQQYELMTKNTCETCGDSKPWICLLNTGIALCQRCAELILRVRF